LLGQIRSGLPEAEPHKLPRLGSSLPAPKDQAKKRNSADPSGSAEQTTALPKAVIQQLPADDGKVSHNLNG